MGKMEDIVTLLQQEIHLGREILSHLLLEGEALGVGNHHQANSTNLEKDKLQKERTSLSKKRKSLISRVEDLSQSIEIGPLLEQVELLKRKILDQARSNQKKRKQGSTMPYLLSVKPTEKVKKQLLLEDEPN